jgi:hypothetical protein
MSTKDGGPAFPMPAGPRDGYGNPTNPPQSGMTLRDWFAGQNAAACLGGLTALGASTSPSDAPKIAQASYMMADALIAERAK